jgi:hypothetical protein
MFCIVPAFPITHLILWFCQAMPFSLSVMIRISGAAICLFRAVFYIIGRTAAASYSPEINHG